MQPACPRIIPSPGLRTRMRGECRKATPLKISEAEMSVRAIRRTLVTRTDLPFAAVTNFYIIIMGGGGGVVSYFAAVGCPRFCSFGGKLRGAKNGGKHESLSLSLLVQGITADVHCLLVLQNDVIVRDKYQGSLPLLMETCVFKRGLQKMGKTLIAVTA